MAGVRLHTSRQYPERRISPERHGQDRRTYSISGSEKGCKNLLGHPLKTNPYTSGSTRVDVPMSGFEVRHFGSQLDTSTLSSISTLQTHGDARSSSHYQTLGGYVLMIIVRSHRRSDWISWWVISQSARCCCHPVLKGAACEDSLPRHWSIPSTVDGLVPGTGTRTIRIMVTYGTQFRRESSSLMGKVSKMVDLTEPTAADKASRVARMLLEDNSQH